MPRRQLLAVVVILAGATMWSMIRFDGESLATQGLKARTTSLEARLAYLEQKTNAFMSWVDDPRLSQREEYNCVDERRVGEDCGRAECHSFFVWCCQHAAVADAFSERMPPSSAASMRGQAIARCTTSASAVLPNSGSKWPRSGDAKFTLSIPRRTVWRGSEHTQLDFHAVTISMSNAYPSCLSACLCLSTSVRRSRHGVTMASIQYRREELLHWHAGTFTPSARVQR
jgi:hypothetical protein